MTCYGIVKGGRGGKRLPFVLSYPPRPTSLSPLARRRHSECSDSEMRNLEQYASTLYLTTTTRFDTLFHSVSNILKK